MNSKTPRRPYKYSRLNAAAHRAIDWIGSVQSLAVHTLAFAGSFACIALGYDTEKVLLVLTTMVSLEAIYLAIFIQMAVNQNSQSLEEVEEDIDEIQEDVEEIQKDVDEIEKDVDDIQEDVEEIQKDVDEIEKDVDEIEKSDEISNKEVMEKLEERLLKIAQHIEKMKEVRKD